MTLPDRAAAQGAIDSTGQMFKGAAAIASERRQMLFPWWDRYQRFDDFAPDQQHAVIDDIHRATIPPGPSHFIDALNGMQPPNPPAAQRHYLPEDLANWLIYQFRLPREQKAKTFDEFAGPSPEQSPLYRAGEATQHLAAPLVTPQEYQQHPYLAGISRGFGSAAPVVGVTIAASALGAPEAALPLGTVLGGLSSAGDQSDQALAIERQNPPQDLPQRIAAEEARTRAAQESFAGNTLLGTVPLGAVLRPIEAAGKGLPSWLLAKALSYAKSAPTFASIGEAQAWLGHKIAQDTYDPNAGYSPDVQRVITSLLTASLGLTHPSRLNLASRAGLEQHAGELGLPPDPAATDHELRDQVVGTIERQTPLPEADAQRQRIEGATDDLAQQQGLPGPGQGNGARSAAPAESSAAAPSASQPEKEPPPENDEGKKDDVRRSSWGIPDWVRPFLSQGFEEPLEVGEAQQLPPEHRGLIFVYETPTGPQHARDFQAGTSGSYLDEDGRFIVPALRYQNPKDGGVHYIKLDGYDLAPSNDGRAMTLIDRKAGWVDFSGAQGNALDALERTKAALEQNPNFKIVYEFKYAADAFRAQNLIKANGYGDIVQVRTAR